MTAAGSDAYGFAAPAVMNPGAYGSPQALFAAAPTAMGPASFMDAFGNIHTTANPAVGDPYGGAALFGAPAAAPATYMYAASSPAAPPMSVLAPGDEIRTVFVSGFPNDVKERELHNLLRFMPGYEASQMNWKTGGPQGFALFSSAGHARAVVDLLGGLQFDDGVVIRAEMAHKNMFIKPEDPSVKRANRASPSLLAPPTTILTPMAQLAHGNGLGPAPLSPAAPPGFLAAAGATGSPPLAAVPGMLASPGPLRPTAFSPVTNLRDNPPCNTLFVGNLGDNTSEQELRTLLSSQPGYRQLKMVRGPKSTTAFVEFSDVPSAMMVHATLQGAVLASSDRGGIRVQYSKNPFGRRDVAASPHASLGGDEGGSAPPSGGGMGLSPRGMAGGGLLGSMGSMQAAAAAAGAAPQVGGPTAGMVGPPPTTFIGGGGMDAVLGGGDG